MKYESKEYWASLIKMSLSRFFILHVLHKQALHGYEITKKVSDITSGCCAPTEGSLYPVLKEFVENELVQIEVQIVSKGERAYEVASQAWGEMAGYILRAVHNDGV